MSETILTERLRLSAPQLDDFDRFYAFWSEEEPDFPTYSPNGLAREVAWARLLRHIGHWTVFGFGPLIVSRINESGMIGEVGMAWFNRGIHEATDAAPEGLWRISYSHRGHGYAQEAMASVLRTADKEWNVERSFAVIDKKNVISQKIANRLGYQPYLESEYKATPVFLLRREKLGSDK